MPPCQTAEDLQRVRQRSSPACRTGSSRGARRAPRRARRRTAGPRRRVASSRRGPARRRRARAAARRGQPQEQAEGDQVGQAVPVDGDGPELQRDRVELGVHQHQRAPVVCRAGARFAARAPPAHAVQARRSAAPRASTGSAPHQAGLAAGSRRLLAAELAVDHAAALELASPLSGTQARPRPADTRLTMVCIWIASCAMCGSRPPAW